MNKSYRNQSGRSMIEMLGVLAIIGVLSAGGIAGYTMAMATYKANKTLDLVKDISTSIKTFYVDEFAGITLPGLVELGKISSEYLKPGTVGTATPVGWTPFGTTYTLSVAADALSYSIALQQIPKNACIKLARTNWGDTNFFVSLVINTEDPILPTSQQQNLAAMNLKCSQDKNTMTWTFK